MSAKHRNGISACALCEEKLTLSHPEIAQWFREEVKPNFPECHISWSYRDKENQDECFAMGKSKLKYPNSKHNKTDDKGNPQARALDLFRLDISGTACWEYKYLKSIADMSSANKDPITWGGTWKSVHGFADFDHFELNNIS